MRKKTQRRDAVLQNVKYSFVWIIPLICYDRYDTVEIRRVYYKGTSYPRRGWYIKNMCLLLSQIVLARSEAHQNSGGNNSIPLRVYIQARCIYNMYTRYTRFIACAYVCVCIGTYRTDRMWDTYRYITLTIYLAIKRNRAGLLLAELCASTLYLQSSPVRRASIICRRHMSRVRTAPHMLVEPILVYRRRRLDWKIELCVDSVGTRENVRK